MGHVFAYGSNMLSVRMHGRVGSAKPVGVGFVTHRRLVFHKRGVDGSSKADAVFTGKASDRVWGVLYWLDDQQRRVLDGYESLGVGYDAEHVLVCTGNGFIHASIYVARREAILHDLRPYSWYQQLVVMGALEHGLPAEYVRHIVAVETVVDPDRARHDHNSQWLNHSSVDIGKPGSEATGA